MTAILDTNVLVRHLIADEDPRSRRATRYLRDGTELVLLTAVLAETIFVLESAYERSRDAIVLAALSLLALPAVFAPEARVLVDALRLYGTRGIHFVDAYVAAVARSSGVGRVASFDRDFDRIDGIERVEP